MKETEKDPTGWCDYCGKNPKPTVMFNERVDGYYGYSVSFEICKDCFLKIIEKEGE